MTDLLDRKCGAKKPENTCLFCDRECQPGELVFRNTDKSALICTECITEACGKVAKHLKKKPRSAT